MVFLCFEMVPYNPGWLQTSSVTKDDLGLLILGPCLLSVGMTGTHRYAWFNFELFSHHFSEWKTINL